MAEIAPFRAVHYNTDRFGSEVGRFVAPPYDVIDRALERRLKNDRLNITHLTLGDEGDGYRTAAKRLERWLNDGVLVRDADECVYIYEQTFQGRDGKVRVRSGIVALVKLEEFSKGVVMPHENTIPKHKADRMALMKALRGNVEQVFMLYDDADETVEELIRHVSKSDEILRFIDPDGVHHRIVRVSDRDVVTRIAEVLESRRLLIADGHHRYETALEYRDMVREKEGCSDGPHDHVLATLVSFRNPGLVIYPAHRLVREVSEEALSSLEMRLEKGFRLERYPSPEEVLEALDGAPDTAFGVWSPATGLQAVALPRKEDGKAGALEGLSVFVLQEKVLKGVLGFTKEMLDKKVNIEYVKELDDAKALLSSGECRLCFFVKAPTAGQVMAVAEEGRKMPHKSTYFFPKIWSGTVLHLFRE